MGWLGRGKRERNAEAAIAAVEDYEGRVSNGEVQVQIEHGDLNPQMFRASFRDAHGGQVGQLMFSWYEPEPPDTDFVEQQLDQFLGACVGLRDGLDMGLTIRFTHFPHMARGEAMLELDMHMIPPDLLQLELVAKQP